MFLSATQLDAQVFKWVHPSVGGVCTTDEYGNVFTVGYLNSATDFDPGPGINILTPVSASGPDFFIMKQDSAGNLKWAKQIGNPYIDQFPNFAGIFSVTVDRQGYIYASGNFYDSIDFDPGP
ncbi:MAG: hypothetical protein EOP47_02790, partial [Sphingobacteriaceae bacterium]